TSHCDCVTITSGCNSRSRAASTRYTDNASPTIFFTRSSISALVPSTLNLGSVSAGRLSTPAGKSHSCERPTSSSRNPSAHTISVALGSRVTIRCIVATPFAILLLLALVDLQQSRRSIDARQGHRARSHSRRDVLANEI